MSNMNYLQYLEGGSKIGVPMKRYLDFLPVIGDQGYLYMNNEFGDAWRNIKKYISKFKENKPVSTEAMYGFVTNVNGIPTIINTNGDRRPLNESDYVLSSTGSSGTILVPKSKS